MSGRDISRGKSRDDCKAAVGSQIAVAFDALALDGFLDVLAEVPAECPACGGDGWYVGHEDECHDTGDCNCSGVQVQCECQQADRG